MKTQITVIKKTSHGAVMSKRIYLDEHRNVKSDGSPCLMVDGIATRAIAETAGVLATIIFDCHPDQAIALGSLKANLPSTVAITTKAKLKENPKEPLI